MSLVYEAMLFARMRHHSQKRKYTGEPYAAHLGEVAGIVAAVSGLYGSLAPDMVAAAWLHDVIEDQGVSHRELALLFGETVANAVLQLSDLETGNREQRKAASRRRLSAADPFVQTIKCADLISNTASIVTHDPKFAVVYLREKELLLHALLRAEPGLLAMAWRQVRAGLAELKA